MRKILLLSLFCPLQFSLYAQDKNPMPAVPAPLAIDSQKMGDWKAFPEVRLDIPIVKGPFEPTWESIAQNYPGEPAWLREAKFGIWVHFGPQASGESGDWYARNGSSIKVGEEYFFNNFVEKQYFGFYITIINTT